MIRRVPPASSIKGFQTIVEVLTKIPLRSREGELTSTKVAPPPGILHVALKLDHQLSLSRLDSQVRANLSQDLRSRSIRPDQCETGFPASAPRGNVAEISSPRLANLPQDAPVRVIDRNSKAVLVHASSTYAAHRCIALAIKESREVFQ